MRWYLLAAVAIGLSNTDVASRAEGPPADQRLSTSRSTPQDAGYFAKSGVVRFHLVQGRLSLDPPRHRKGSQSRDKDGVYESITVTAERGIPSLHYICQTPEQHITLSVQQARHVRIESYCPPTADRSVLEQPYHGLAVWTLHRGDLKEQHEGTTLLHLRQRDPVSFDEHHGPLMQRLLQGRSVKQITDATNESLLRRTAESEIPDVESIHELVDELRSSRRAHRIKAERRLLSWGTPIVPVLLGLPRDSLDAEQLDRIDSILRRLRVQVNDTPATLAMLLINDREYWSLLAPKLSVAQLERASHHFVRSGLDVTLPADTANERIAAATE